MTVRSLTCILFACLLLSSYSARAEWTATAQITNLSLTVQDLTPGDGQTAELYYGNAHSYRAGWLDINGTSYSEFQHSDQLPVPPDMGLYYASHGASIELEILPGMFSSRSESTGTSATMNTDVERSYIALTSSLGLGLAPHSALRMSVQFSGALQRVGHEADPFQAHSFGQIYALTPTGPIGWDQGVLMAHGDDADMSLDRELSFVVRNDSDAVSYFSVYVEQYTAVTMTAPVPEPATYAMLLAGLVLLSPHLRRRMARLRG
ncbi:PEP-CTERM sorting domain-containing protein [Massilia endophytica]|uniref:PEP-CTERM sorting domain-containing protein n=1 Tax=Massilia endophytica TaxID=2899220 RepID=UPI001E3B33B7|nr:PEP-CTERM sorting domain-containing protein [Massilia endophytica]UGQ45709.1 PEP-CTERM sorting domain-containing protein [Massilia endophytica]